MSTGECVQRRKESGLGIAFAVEFGLGCSARVEWSELRRAYVLGRLEKLSFSRQVEASPARQRRDRASA